ncbi:unnamed protein product [Alopecurus aequalis]
METNQHRQGSPPPTTRRSRTRRDPAQDHVYRVPLQNFAHTVQKLTGAAPPRTSPPPRGDQQPLPATPPPPTLSMQEAYLEWCASNGSILSPGTIAEIDCASRFNQGINN